MSNTKLTKFSHNTRLIYIQSCNIRVCKQSAQQWLSLHDGTVWVAYMTTKYFGSKRI